VNATRGGSDGSDVDVYDPRTGKPLKFTYAQEGNDPESHAIRAALPMPVPEGGIGRVLIYKTYKDPRTYMMHGDDIVWVRSLSGYRLGVLLPKGFAFLSSIVAAPETGRMKVEQTYSDDRKGDKAKLDSLAYLPLQDLEVVDLDTAKRFARSREGGATVVKLDVPIVDDKQSAHLEIKGTIKDDGYRLDKGDLVFDRMLHGLRNTILLPAGWEVSAVSQSGTIGMYQGRSFVALINLNAENAYRVVIHATASSSHR
jgi:hypothetical protein